MPLYEQQQFRLGSIPVFLPTEQPFAYLIAALLFALTFYSVGQERETFPLLNPKRLFDLSNQKRITEFCRNSTELLKKGKALYRNQPFRIFTPDGELVSLPASAIDEIRSHPSISTLHIDRKTLPGFEPFAGNAKLRSMINHYITRIIGKLTGPLSEEAGLALSKTFLDSPEWREIVAAETILPVVTQVSTRVFMGEEGCRDERWTRASGAYAAVAFHTMDEMRTWPKFLRRWVHWYLPSCRDLRARLDEARRAIQVHIDKRAAVKAAAAAKGEPVPEFDDALDWAEKEDPGHDPAILQILLSLVAIHTTSDLLQQAMIRIAQHPELFEELREEIVRVLRAEGLKKTALYELKLMDSVLKETQRMKPILLTPMRRRVTQDVQLSSGAVLRQGQIVTTDSTHMWDAAYYENPDTFDGHRFLRRRDQGQGQRKGQQYHLSSTSADHLGFGHGPHSCPGRFFAANEIKVLLCHLLLKYDWSLSPENPMPRATCNGFFIVGDRDTKFLIRRREAELDFGALEV